MNDVTAHVWGFDTSDPNRHPTIPDSHPDIRRGEEYLIQFATIGPDGQVALDGRFSPIRFTGQTSYVSLWAEVAEAAHLLLEQCPDVDQVAVAIGIAHNGDSWLPEPETWPCVKRRMAQRMVDVALGKRRYLVSAH
jgi:hypothetical protein